MPNRKTQRRTVLRLVLIIVLIAGYTGWASLRPLPATEPVMASQVTATPAQKISLPWPAYGEAAFGTAGYGVIATNGTQTPLPTASTAKVITALAVLRQYPLRAGENGPSITIQQADLDSYNKYVAQDGSVVQVSLGEQLTERQALEALLLPSANNMAETLARWAFGSIKNYTDYANAYTKSIGLTSVTVTDPSGFLPTTVASAHDLTIIGELAMLNPVFANIVAEPTATIPVQGQIKNYNSLLGHNGNIGIKTGNNDQDKGVYLFAQEVSVGTKNLTLVGAVMGGPDLDTTISDAASLANVVSTQFSITTVLKAGQPIATYHVPGQTSVQAVSSQDLTTLNWNGASSEIESNLQPIRGPQAAHTIVGTTSLSTSLGSSKTSVAVELQSAVQKPSLVWRFSHPL